MPHCWGKGHAISWGTIMAPPSEDWREGSTILSPQWFPPWEWKKQHHPAQGNILPKGQQRHAWQSIGVNDRALEAGVWAASWQKNGNKQKLGQKILDKPSQKFLQYRKWWPGKWLTHFYSRLDFPTFIFKAIVYWLLRLETMEKL